MQGGRSLIMGHTAVQTGTGTGGGGGRTYGSGEIAGPEADLEGLL